MSSGYKDDKFSMGRRDHFVTIGDYDSATAPEYFKESLRNQGYVDVRARSARISSVRSLDNHKHIVYEDMNHLTHVK